MIHDSQYLIFTILLFINGIGGAKSWARERPGWAGAYAAGFVGCAVAM